MLIKIFTVVCPWPLKRLILKHWFKYDIDSTARIGWSWIFPKRLVMASGAIIDHFNVAVNFDDLKMGQNSFIGRSNWITGFPTGTNSMHFKHQTGRKAELIIGEHAAITKKHHIDCTNSITIGNYSTIAGYNSQLLTHSIDVVENRQDSAPITIGDYTFVASNVIVLGGAALPAHCILGAKSMLNKKYHQEWALYGGVPTRFINNIPQTAKYFTRREGFVY